VTTTGTGQAFDLGFCGAAAFLPLAEGRGRCVDRGLNLAVAGFEAWPSVFDRGHSCPPRRSRGGVDFSRALACAICFYISLLVRWSWMTSVRGVSWSSVTSVNFGHWSWMTLVMDDQC
jgi:hypothetical protein